MWEGLHEKESGVANYYIADLHRGHENVIRFDNRPFANLEEMHRTIIDNWNRTVLASDTVYILGDMIWGKEAEWLPWLSHFSGKKVLITLTTYAHATQGMKRESAKRMDDFIHKLQIEGKNRRSSN